MLITYQLDDFIIKVLSTFSKVVGFGATPQGLDFNRFSATGKMIMIKRSLLYLIRFYQKWISPCLPRVCRFYPSCSRYCYLAIKERGVFVGLLLGIWRILRCNPFSKGGYDPVPLKSGSCLD